MKKNGKQINEHIRHPTAATPIGKNLCTKFHYHHKLSQALKP